MTCVLFVKWIKFSVKKDKTLKRNTGKMGKNYCQGILSVQKSGNHVVIYWSRVLNQPGKPWKMTIDNWKTWENPAILWFLMLMKGFTGCENFWKTLTSIMLPLGTSGKIKALIMIFLHYTHCIYLTKML